MGEVLPYLPPEIWDKIYFYAHDLSEVHHEILSNCAIRRTYGSPRFRTIIFNEMAFHKSVNKIYSNTKYWKTIGYCSVKCGSLNWPHACNFCNKCNADPDFCNCYFIHKGIITFILIHVFAKISYFALNFFTKLKLM